MKMDNSKYIFHLFANYYQQVSLPLGLRNVAYGTWLCQERGWSGHHYGCNGLANYNRRWFGS